MYDASSCGQKQKYRGWNKYYNSVSFLVEIGKTFSSLSVLQKISERFSFTAGADKHDSSTGIAASLV
jgi:hypothetical protein